MAIVVHCKRAAKGTFAYIGRPSLLGNPFPLNNPGDDAERSKVIDQYRTWFLGRVDNTAFRAALEEVRGRNLGCWCAPKPCHGDVILEWLESHPV